MWIESHQSIRSHPKIKKAARLANVSEPEMVGLLHYMWWWALDYAPDGDVTRYSQDDIEMAVDWNGTPGAFYNALLTCGFNDHSGLLESDGQRIVIHDWHQYGGKLLERRTEDAERKRQARRKTSEGHPEDDEQTAHVDNKQNKQNKQTKNTPSGEKKAPRPRDLLFDAIAEVCRVDPATAGSSIAKVESALKKATPPYTPEEVKAFGVKWWEWKERTDPPSIWKLKEQIGTVRQNGQGKHAATTDSTPSGNGSATQYTPEQLAAAAEINARRAAKQAAHG